jgi:hypothetical protein
MRAKGIRRPLEVETRTLDELRQVLALLDAATADGGGPASPGGMVTRIMLDNMTRRDPQAPGKHTISACVVGVVQNRRSCVAAPYASAWDSCRGTTGARSSCLPGEQRGGAARKPRRQCRAASPGPYTHLCLLPPIDAAGLDVSTLRQAMALIGDRAVETEASGNVTLETVGCAAV